MNALDYAGYSCLSLAAAKGRVLIARLLIKKELTSIYRAEMPGGRSTSLSWSH